MSGEDILKAGGVVLAAFGGLATIGKGVDVIKGWTAPSKKINERLDEYDKKFSNDKRRLDRLEGNNATLAEGLQVLCSGMKALLSHETKGDHDDCLLAAQKEVDNFLIKQMGKN